MRRGGWISAITFVLIGTFLAAGAGAQTIGWPPPPKFEDFPATEQWSGKSAAVKLTSRSETMFRTRLTEASLEKPNFAGHYRFAFWGCGSNCAAGAIVDLETGT